MTSSALSRALALFLSAFALVSLAGDILSPGFDATLLWLDLQALPRPAGRFLLLAGAAALLAHALRPSRQATV